MSNRKTPIVLGLLLVLLLCVTGCTGDEPAPSKTPMQTLISSTTTPQPAMSTMILNPTVAPERVQIVPMDVNDVIFVPSTAPDYAISVITDKADYFFENDAQAKNIQAVRECELMIAVAEQEYGFFLKRLKIYFTSDDTRVGVNTARAVINLDDPYMAGVLFYQLSGRTLPAWLCAGIEAYWMNECGLKTTANNVFDAIAWQKAAAAKSLPVFGDAWFIPGLLDDRLQEDAHLVAQAFIAYLQENKSLEGLIQAYKSPKGNPDDLFAQQWENFTGQQFALEEGLKTFRYFYVSPKATRTDQFFSVVGSEARYTFENYSWTMQMVKARIESSDMAIRYTMDWFEYTPEEPSPLEVVFFIGESAFPDRMIAEQTVSSGIPYIHVYKSVSSFAPDVMAHEATHWITREMGYLALYLFEGQLNPLSEGFCEAVSYHFFAENYAYLMAWIEVNPFKDSNNPFPYRTQETYFASYEELTGRQYTDTDSDEVYAYFLADILVMANWHYTEKKVLIKTLADMEPYIDGASFVSYLLREKGKEAYLSFYRDKTRAQEIYGKSIEELISDWWRYLGFTL